MYQLKRKAMKLSLIFLVIALAPFAAGGTTHDNLRHREGVEDNRDEISPGRELKNKNKNKSGNKAGSFTGTLPW